MKEQGGVIVSSRRLFHDFLHEIEEHRLIDDGEGRFSPPDFLSDIVGGVLFLVGVPVDLRHKPELLHVGPSIHLVDRLHQSLLMVQLHVAEEV